MADIRTGSDISPFTAECPLCSLISMETKDPGCGLNGGLWGPFLVA